MNPLKTSKKTESSSTTENFIITLIPCDFDSSEEENEKSVNESQDSLNSSDILDSFDDEVEMINEIEIIRPEKDLEIIKEVKIKSNKIIIA